MGYTKEEEYQNSRDSRNEEENSTRRSLKTKRNGGKSFVVVTRRVVTSRRKLKRSEERRRNEKKTKLRSGEIKNFAVVVQTRHNQPSVFSSSNVSKEHCSLGETIGSSLVDRINIYIFVHWTVIKGGGRPLISITIEHVSGIMHVSLDADALKITLETLTVNFLD